MLTRCHAAGPCIVKGVTSIEDVARNQNHADLNLKKTLSLLQKQPLEAVQILVLKKQAIHALLFFRLYQALQ